MYLTGIIFTLSIFLFPTCQKNGTGPDKNKEPDTTSHDILWQIDTIGSYGSIFRDVAVINDTLIWAVGQIYDDARNKYGAAIWNGREWSFKYFRLPTMSGGTITPQGIWAFSEINIWLVWGHIYNWNGQSFKQVHKITEPIGGINKIWASSENDIWFVGTKGLIIHYDGSSFTTMEKLTDIELTDVWGSPDGSVVWACGFENLKGSVLLCNQGKGFKKVARVERPGIPDTANVITKAFKRLWTNNSDTVYIAAIGRIYHTPVDYSTEKYARENFWYDYQNESGYPNETWAFRGLSKNDLFVAGYRNFIRHYNGKSWFQYNEILADGIWKSLDVGKNIIVAVGTLNGYQQTAICIGRR